MLGVRDPNVQVVDALNVFLAHPWAISIVAPLLAYPWFDSDPFS
jgi:hypothetical protein